MGLKKEKNKRLADFAVNLVKTQPTRSPDTPENIKAKEATKARAAKKVKSASKPKVSSEAPSFKSQQAKNLAHKKSTKRISKKALKNIAKAGEGTGIVRKVFKPVLGKVAGVAGILMQEPVGEGSDKTPSQEGQRKSREKSRRMKKRIGIMEGK